MKNSQLRGFVAATIVASFSPFFDSKAVADDWGCQVILCLSSPGGPTQYAECRPPISKLWRWLAKGRSFPTCSGVGFQSSRPGFEPYNCNDGYRLTGSSGPRGRDATCVSISPQPVSNRFCASGRDEGGSDRRSVLAPRWQREGGRLQCVARVITRPNVRQQPHYIDVIIDSADKQRVWY